jgi:hypothetical protein
MTTIQIDTNDNQVIQQVVNYVTGTLHYQAKVVTNVGVENLTQNSNRKSKWEKIDEQLRSLKDINTDGAKELEESFTILREEAKKLDFLTIKQPEV